MIAANSLLYLVVELVIVGLIFWLVLWFVDWVGVPQPVNKVIKVVVGLVLLLGLVNLLLGFVGHPLFMLR